MAGKGIASIAIGPIPTFFRFHEGYIYVTFQDGTAIEDEKKLPKAAMIFIKEETAILAVRLHIEGVPEEVRKTARTLFKQPGEAGKVRPTEMMIMGLVVGMVGANDMADFYNRLVRLVDEGQWAALRIDFVEQLTVDFDLIPRRGSVLAREIADFKPRPASLGGLLDDDTAIGLANSFGAFGGLKIDPIDMEEGLSDLLKVVGLVGEAGNVAPLAKALVESIRVDEADLAVALKKSKAKDTYAIVLAGKLKKAKTLEGAMIGYLNLLPKEKRQHFTAEAVKLDNGAAVHKLSLPELSEKGKAIFGDGDLYFSFDNDGLYAAFGASGLDRLKEALKLTKKEGSRFLVRTDPTLLTGIVNAHLGGNEFKVWNSRFPVSEKISLLSGKVEGGSRLEVKYTIDLVPFLKMGELFSTLW